VLHRGRPTLPSPRSTALRYHKIIIMSVDADEHVFVRDRRGVQLVRIGAFIDRALTGVLPAPHGVARRLSDAGDLGEGGGGHNGGEHDLLVVLVQRVERVASIGIVLLRSAMPCARRKPRRNSVFAMRNSMAPRPSSRLWMPGRMHARRRDGAGGAAGPAARAAGRSGVELHRRHAQ